MCSTVCCQQNSAARLVPWKAWPKGWMFWARCWRAQNFPGRENSGHRLQATAQGLGSPVSSECRKYSQLSYTERRTKITISQASKTRRGHLVTIQRSKRSHTKRTNASELYSERSCFEADRSAMVDQLRALGSAIEDGASEIAMIAAENVFEGQVSRILTGISSGSHRMVRGLNELRGEVARARRR